ncbi:hypothetical protein IE53DRAFT_366437 [Violaceomyces palustris]|uniref:Uncharacterized protein n=1 Tax=Violaceomyces palustris TaxID=1673888 RepID=A0ACD0P5L9_9BASI|nr:hypothetical protein IE53DRAFT_366437 [Violaceomyces palustris]
MVKPASSSSTQERIVEAGHKGIGQHAILTQMQRHVGEKRREGDKRVMVDDEEIAEEEKDQHHPLEAFVTRMSSAIPPLHSRHVSTQSLRLDLEGLDLGGSPGGARAIPGSNLCLEPSFNDYLLSKSLGAPTKHSATASTTVFPKSQGPLLSWQQANFARSVSDASFNTDRKPRQYSTEDSFAAHLREECSDSYEILNADAVLEAETGGVGPMKRPSPFTQHGDACPEQVLGGFASLGVACSHTFGCAHRSQRNTRTKTVESVDSSDYPVTPGDRSPGILVDPIYQDASRSIKPTKWQNICTRPSDPLETLDILSIDEMGLHSLDVGNVDDWEGCRLGSGHFAVQADGDDEDDANTCAEWEIARSMKRQRKWVVAPHLSPQGRRNSNKLADTALRTVVVTDRPLSFPESLDDFQPVEAFSGSAGFELKFLRGQGALAQTIYLANPESHRILHGFRTGSSTPVTTVDGGLLSSPLGSTAESQYPVYPAYPELRRSRSRPNVRNEPHPMRRSRSKPYLRYSAKQRIQIESEFAPSLPGDPVAKVSPDEFWPSARSFKQSSVGSESRRPSDGSSDYTPAIGASKGETSKAGSPDNMGPKEDFGPSSSMSSGNTQARSSETEAPLSSRTEFHASLDGTFSVYSQGASYFAGAKDPLPRASTQTSILHEDRTRFWSQSLREEGLSYDDQRHALEPGSELVRPSSKRSAAASVARSSLQSKVSDQDDLQRSPASKIPVKKEKKISEWFKKIVLQTNTIAPSAPPFAGAPLSLASPTRARSSTRHTAAQTLSISSDKPRFSEPFAYSLPPAIPERLKVSRSRSVSPDSTVMGSRRGSEAILSGTAHQAASESLPVYSMLTDQNIAALQRASHTGDERGRRSNRPQAGEVDAREHSPQVRTSRDEKKAKLGRMSPEEARQAVAASLARTYGWSADIKPRLAVSGVESTASRSPDCSDGISSEETDSRNVKSGRSDTPGWFEPDSHPRHQNSKDDENALLGISAVPPDALTMLIPLPALGRLKDEEIHRYLRVAFVPFGERPTLSPPPHSSQEPQAQDKRPAKLSPSASQPGNASSPYGLAPMVPAPSSQSSWYRKLGLATSKASSSNGNASLAKGLNAAVEGVDQDAGPLKYDRCRLPTRRTSVTEAFRVSALVVEVPERNKGADVCRSVGLPEAGTFPVVIAFCDGRKSIELVPEGWEALCLGDGPANVCDHLKNAGREGFNHLQPCSCAPMAGVADLIIAACSAVMDL